MLVSKNNIDAFNEYLHFLETLGYSSQYKILNGVDYGIPQNRERVFLVSIYGDYSIHFGEKIPLKKRLKDMLQPLEEVEEKYFLSKSSVDNMINWNSYRNPLDEAKDRESEISDCITAKSNTTNNASMLLIKEKVPLKRGYDVEIQQEQEDTTSVDVIGNYSKSGYNQTQIVGKNGIAPTITENHGQVTGIVIKNNTKKGYLIGEDGDGVDISGRMQDHRGTVQKGLSLTINTKGGNDCGVIVSDSLTDLEKQMITEDGNIKRYLNSDKVDTFNDGECAYLNYPNGYGHGKRTSDKAFSLTCVGNTQCVKSNLLIRKLTNLECFRLMGLTDDEARRIMKNQSQSSNFHLAGDSIIVDVLSLGVFKYLFRKE